MMSDKGFHCLCISNYVRIYPFLSGLGNRQDLFCPPTGGFNQHSWRYPSTNLVNSTSNGTTTGKLVGLVCSKLYMVFNILPSIGYEISYFQNPLE